MIMVLETEIKLSKKYILGEYLDSKDEYMIDKMEMIGLMHTGLSISNMCRTAKTTNFAVRVFELKFYKQRQQLKRWLTDKLTF